MYAGFYFGIDEAFVCTLIFCRALLVAWVWWEGVDANNVTEGFEFVGGVVCGGLEHWLPFLEVEDASVRHGLDSSEDELVQ